MPIPKEILDKVLQESVRAPSADNMQPWQFKTLENSDLEIIPILSLPDLDYFDYKGRLTQIGIGALEANIEIVANHYGFQTKTEYFPWKKNTACMRISFNSSDKLTSDDALYSAVSKRATNRNPYSITPLDPTITERLISHANSAGLNLTLFSDLEIKNALATLATTNERVVLQSEVLHRTFRSHITWNKKHEKKVEGGLLVDALGLNPVQRLAFQAVRSWKVLSILNEKIGFSNFIASENAALYAKSGAIALLAIPNYESETILRAGKVFQKIWLEITAADMNLQPITGITFLHQMQTDGNLSWIPKHLQSIVSDSLNHFNLITRPSTHAPLILFRVGKAAKKSVATLRREPFFIS